MAIKFSKIIKSLAKEVDFKFLCSLILRQIAPTARVIKLKSCRT